jgi:hypothetical protein
MQLSAKPGGMFKVTISKAVTRAGALTTLERLFMRDPTVAGPILARSANHLEQPKRRGGCIWTKRPNKVHPRLETGATCTVPATPQYAKDLNSVAPFVSVEVV